MSTDMHELQDAANSLLNKIGWKLLKGEPVFIEPMPFIYQELTHAYKQEWFKPITDYVCDADCGREAVVLVSYHRSHEGYVDTWLCPSCSVIEAVDIRIEGFYPVISSLRTQEYL